MIRGIFNSLAMGIAVLAMHGASADTLITSTVTSVYPLSSGAFIITIRDDVPACYSALSPKQFHVQVGMNGVTEASLKLIYAASLVAVAGGHTVTFGFDESSTQCYIDRLQVFKND